MKFKVGDRVEVLDQYIRGEILRIYLDTNEIVIIDEDSEYESPDDELVYRTSELKKIKE